MPRKSVPSTVGLSRLRVQNFAQETLVAGLATVTLAETPVVDTVYVLAAALQGGGAQPVPRYAHVEDVVGTTVTVRVQLGRIPALSHGVAANIHQGPVTAASCGSVGCAAGNIQAAGVATTTVAATTAHPSTLLEDSTLTANLMLVYLV